MDFFFAYMKSYLGRITAVGNLCEDILLSNNINLRGTRIVDEFRGASLFVTLPAFSFFPSSYFEKNV